MLKARSILCKLTHPYGEHSQGQQPLKGEELVPSIVYSFLPSIWEPYFYHQRLSKIKLLHVPNISVVDIIKCENHWIKWENVSFDFEIKLKWS